MNSNWMAFEYCDWGYASISTAMPDFLEKTSSVAVGAQGAQTGAGAGVPDPDAPVSAAAGQQAAVIRERHAPHAGVTPVECLSKLPGAGVPEAHGPALACTGHHLPVSLNATSCMRAMSG